MLERSRQAGDSVSEAPLISGLSPGAYDDLKKFVLAERLNLVEAIDWDALFDDLSVCLRHPLRVVERQPIKEGVFRIIDAFANLFKPNDRKKHEHYGR